MSIYYVSTSIGLCRFSFLLGLITNPPYWQTLLSK